MNHRDRDNGRAIPPATENYAPILSLLTDAPFIIFALQIFVHPFLRKGRTKLFLACLLVRFNHVARCIVNANHRIA
jgi:hypothetical protein